MARERPRLTPVALALWSVAEGARVVQDLAARDVPVLLLKGPRLQERLYGSPAVYVSSDVDVLVPRSRASHARNALLRAGWEFEPDNGVLWRLSAAASYERDGFRLDLHWGLHAAHLPAWSLRSLEEDLWRRASAGPDGFLIPDAESLFVYLAIHAVGHGFERAHWVENVYAAAAQVTDWSSVWRIARRARVSGAVRAAMSEHPPGTRLPVLDGVVGRAVWFGTYVMRGHALPRRVRDRARELRAMRREGFGLLRGAPGHIAFEGLQLEVDPGVFDPQEVSALLVETGGRHVDADPHLVVDVGSGSGAVALLASTRWPDAEIVGIDASMRAVANARRNARRLGLGRVHFEHGSLLDPIPPRYRGRTDLIMSNVPYVSAAGGRKLDDWRVPINSVFGPENDGLGLMRALARQVKPLLRPGGLWVFQLGDSQWEAWRAHLHEFGYETIPPVERRPGNAIVAAARPKAST